MKHRRVLHRRIRFGSLLALALAATALVGAASPARGSMSLGTTTLNRDVVHYLSAATLLGPVPASQQVTVGVVLKNPSQAAEDAYLAQLYDPSSASYQQFLDPGQFATQFGVPASTVSAATSWLAGGGLSVSAPEGATTYLQASGTAAQMSALFSTPLNLYSAGGRTFYANAAAPAVPSTLPVQTVLGLNDYAFFMAPRRGATGPRTYSVTSGGVPETSLLAPKTLWSIYDQPSSNLGNGQTMGILGWGVTTGVEGDLRSFEQENELPQVPLTTKYYGSTATPDTSGDGATVEWELDTQASTGMAPDVQGETLYFAHHNTDADVFASWVGWVNDKHGPSQASASYGECENIPQGEAAIGVDGLEGPGDSLLKQAAIEGRTLFSSTGDTGSSCPIVAVPVVGGTNGVASQGYPGLNYPSASPFAVAVGGTVLSSDGGNPPKRFSEVAWEYGGGGNSVAEPAGSYQQGVAKVSCVEDQSGNPYTPGSAPLCRSTPDVAAISGDVGTNNGMLITDDNGADQQGAGTSLSSPLWLGMWTRIQAAAKGKGLGFADYSLYKAAKSASYANDFYDVTIGDNQPYPATPGYDNATGWGAPDVAHLMQDLTGRVTPVHNLAPPVAAQPTPQVSGCGTLFTDGTGDDAYLLSSQGANPQLDIVNGQMCLTPDGKTLRTILTINNLSATVPSGGVENDYNFVWSFNGTSYFTQLAVEQTGTVLAYDGQAVHASLETRFQQLHVDTGIITPGPNGTVEVDVPIANIGSPASGSILARPSAQSYVREGAVAGSLEPADSAGPSADFLIP